MLSAARLPQVRAEVSVAHYKPFENEVKFGELKFQLRNES